MSELIKNQNYGVEIEFTGITRRMAANIVAEVLNSRASAPTGGCYHTQTIRDSKGRNWKIMRDSSIRPECRVGRGGYDEYKVEFVTPILQYGDLDTLQAIVRKFREKGAVANDSCGIHVHVDGSNHNANSLKNLVNFMYSRQDIIYEALAVGDRKDRWCKPICRELRQSVRKQSDPTVASTEQIWYSKANDSYLGGVDHQHYNPTRYHALNLHSFFSKGTVEFRLFNSTLHAGKVKAYVQFCLAISAWAIEENGNTMFRKTAGYTAKQKLNIMQSVLTNRLGVTGKEFETCRFHLLKELRETAAREQMAA